jgi:hypothetical protein
MSQATAYEQFMLELVNRERARKGAQPLAGGTSPFTVLPSPHPLPYGRG